jgi:4'-phosphopantetheinyl transferase
MPAIAPRTWAPGPAHPRLAVGDVHVWRVDLTSVTDGVAELLCGEEQARGERLLNKRNGQLWMRSRGVLRALLGRYLQEDPRTLRFSAGAHGKPALRQHRLSFNLAHSGRLALYAIAQKGAVGVDVEMARRPVNEVTLAERTFGPAEARRLSALDRADRAREFRRLWVRHEAQLKCRGTGIADGASGASAGELWIAELDVGARAAAAVAADAPQRELRRWDWQI